MLIFLYGQDTYRLKQKLNEIIERYNKTRKSGLNLKFFEGDQLKFQLFKDEIRTVSMFAEKKLIVLKNIFKNKSFKESFFDFSKKLLKTDDVIIVYEEGGEISLSDPLVKFLKKSGKSQELKILTGQKLKDWIRKEFINYKAEFEEEVVGKLVDFVGDDLWQLSNEIKKLVNYKNGKKITTKDIDILVGQKTVQVNIFKTIDALALKNKKQALSLLHWHLEKGDDLLYLLSMITFQFRNLLIVKELSQKYQSPYVISKISKIHPYVVAKTYSQAQKFTIVELKKIYQKIFEVDVSIKTGRLKKENYLDLLIANI